MKEQPSETPEILPCPFCHTGQGQSVANAQTGEFTIVCTACLASGPLAQPVSGVIAATIAQQTEIAAIKAWNNAPRQTVLELKGTVR